MATIKVPIYAIIGTRAQFIKVAPLLRMMLDQGIDYKLIYTAQHKETIGEILDVYQLPAPDKVLYKYEEAKTRKLFMKWLFAMAKLTLFESKKILPVRGIVLTHGDTFTTWIAALMGKLAGCKIAHLESGLRSFNLLEPFPEEIVRLVTFILSDVYFCPGDWAVSNLKRFRGKKVNTQLNPIYDAIQFALNNYPKKDFDFQQEPYVVVSIHRYENIFTNRFTDTILPILEDIARDKVLVFTLHPTTKVRLEQLGLMERLRANKNIILHDRFDFLDWIKVCSKSEFVITDGGSNQEELTYLGIPTLLFRMSTERQEGLNENVVLSKLDNGIISDFISRYKEFRRPMVKSEISPSQIIINSLRSNEII